MEPSSDRSSDPGIDPLEPLRRSAGVAPVDVRDRVLGVIDDVRAGGPTRWLIAAVAVLLLGAGVVAITWPRSSSGAPHDAASSLPFARGATATSASPGSGSTGTTVAAAAELIVQAAGAVVHPGVYHLPAGSRVADLVVAAGGLAVDADADRLNLASPLVDGAQVYAPHVGETDPPGPVIGGGSGSSSGSATGSSAPASIDLNAATAEELDTLPGVGPATAAAIIDYRQRNGPFHSVDDLGQVRGIGDAKLAQLRDRVHV